MSSATAAVPGLPDFHHTKSIGQALRVSLVKPGAYLSASYLRFLAPLADISSKVCQGADSPKGYARFL